MKNLLIKMIHLFKKDDYNKKDKDCGANLCQNKKSSKIFSYILINILICILYIKFILFIQTNIIKNNITYHIEYIITKIRICQYKKNNLYKNTKVISFKMTKNFQTKFWFMTIVTFTTTYMISIFFGRWENIMSEIIKSCFIAVILWSLWIYFINITFKYKKTKILLSIVLTIIIGLGITSNIMSIKHHYKKLELEKQIVQQKKEEEKLFIITQQQELQNKQEQFLIEQKEKQELNITLRMFSDYYLDYTKQSFDTIQNDTFDWGTHLFVLNKNDNNKSIEFSLIDKSTNQVIKSQVRQYK